MQTFLSKMIRFSVTKVRYILVSFYKIEFAYFSTYYINKFLNQRNSIWHKWESKSTLNMGLYDVWLNVCECLCVSDKPIKIAKVDYLHRTLCISNQPS